MRIVFLGDSLTEGVDGASYLRVLRERVASDPRMRGIELVNAGVGGDTVLNLARRVARDVIPQPPDWVVIFVGVNDFRTWYVRRSLPTIKNIGSAYYFLRRKGIWRAITPRRYEVGLRALIDVLRLRTRARIAVCTPATASEWLDARAETLLDRYTERARQVADERRCALIDVRSTFLAAERRLGRIPATSYRLTYDGVHLSDEGAEVVAAAVYDWLASMRLSNNNNA